MVKLIVCDIDNTIVPKHKKPSAGTMECIHEFEKRGILFGFASGRTTNMLKDLATQWGIKVDLMIGLNGGEYLDTLTGEYDVIPKMSGEDFREIFKIMEPFRDRVNPSLINNNEFIVRKATEEILTSIKYSKTGLSLKIAESDEDFFKQEAYKIGFRMDKDTMKEVEVHASKFHSDRYKSFKTEFTMYEFCPGSVNKGEMLKRFCNRHNIDIKDTYAFGDMDNDISILEAAGTGVCLLNGSDKAKAAADYVTEKTIDDDGFADYVKRYIL